jgi:hypothetical protein
MVKKYLPFLLNKRKILFIFAKQDNRATHQNVIDNGKCAIRHNILVETHFFHRSTYRQVRNIKRFVPDGTNKYRGGNNLSTNILFLTELKIRISI